ncbi:MAG: hypothetical protein KIS66_09550 [Fimbriimonadaceae bacterium]|nr:hypothetical protein [Fimbriimonadaceae bacterium]
MKRTLPALGVPLLAGLVVLASAQTGPGPRSPRDLSESRWAPAREAKAAKPLPPKEWRKRFKSLSGGWKEAEKYLNAARLFPYDAIPEGAVERAIAHRDNLPPAQIGAHQDGSLVPNGNWSFVGPKNLNVPYRRWWGPPPVSGRINGAAFDPVVAGRYYAALPNGGLWRTDDFGVTWNNLSTSPAWTTLETTCVAIDPTNNQHILVGMGDWPTNLMWLGSSPGIMRSTDGGTTWNLVGTNLAGRTVSDIVFNPADPTQVVATLGRGPLQTGGIARSTSSGATWNLGGTGNFSGAALSLPRPDNRRNLYAVADGNFMTRSRDFGGTWTNVALPAHGAGAFMAVTTSPNVADRVFIMYCTAIPASPGVAAVPGEIWRSDDAGGTWVNLTPNTGGAADFQDGWWGQASYNYTIEALKKPWDPGNDLLYVGVIGVFLLDNPEAASGFVWADLGQTARAGTGSNPLTGSPAVTHNDQHVFVRDATGFDMLIGNDGGLYRLNFHAFNNLNFNLSASHFYHASFHPTDRDQMIGGTQDNATPTTAAAFGTGDIDNWNNVGGGDGGWSLIDWNNPNIQYASVQGGGLFRTTDSWGPSWNRNTLPGITGTRTDNNQFPFITVLEMQKTDPKLVWAASNTRLYRWNQTAGTWTNRVGNWQLAGAGDIRAVCTSPSDAGYVLVGALDGETWLSEQAFASDRFRIDNPAGGTQLPDRVVSDFSFHPTDANSFLVSLGGFGAAHLWQGTWDPVANSITWANVSGTGSSGLPDVQVNTIERDPWDPTNIWYVGTDIGVFMTNNGGATWTNGTQPLGLPPVAVFHLQYVPGTRYLNAATWGRGIWRIPLGRPMLLRIEPRTLVIQGGLKIPTRLYLSYPVNEPVPIRLSASNLQMVTLPQTVTFDPGKTELEFDILTQFTEGHSEPVTIYAETGGFTEQVTIRIDPTEFTVTLEPNSVQGGSLALGTVFLAAPAPPGLKVGLRSDHPSVATVNPPSVDFNEGETVGYFMVNTTDEGFEDRWARIVAILGQTERDAWIEVVPLQIESVTCNSPLLRAGSTYEFTVRLRKPSSFNSDIQLGSSHAACPVPSSVTFAPGQQEATISVTIGEVFGRDDVLVYAMKGQSFAFVTVPLTFALLTGQVTREGLAMSADPGGRVAVSYREPGTTNELATGFLDLDNQGRFSVDALRVAPFDVAIKDANWLRVVRTFDAANPVSLSFSLPNGDVNGDNAVNIADFLQLRAAFGSSEGAGNWNPMADLNRDGSVNLQDFLILRANFGRSGKP